MEQALISDELLEKFLYGSSSERQVIAASVGSSIEELKSLSNAMFVWEAIKCRRAIPVSLDISFLIDFNEIKAILRYRESIKTLNSYFYSQTIWEKTQPTATFSVDENQLVIDQYNYSSSYVKNILTEFDKLRNCTDNTTYLILFNAFEVQLSKFANQKG